MREKFADWTARHRLSFVLGSLAVAMTAAGDFIFRARGSFIFYSSHVSRHIVCVRALIDHLLGSLWAPCRPIATYLPVRHEWGESLLRFSVVLIWPCQVVQVRVCTVWAQGLTLGVIIATGAPTQRAKVAQMRKVRVALWCIAEGMS